MDSYQQLPKLPGVYFFKNAAGKIIYVGKAKSLRDRVSSYFRSASWRINRLQPRTAQLVSEIAQIDHLVVESEIDALLLEANLIRKLAPRYNVDWKDGKAYPLIEITIKEKVPQVHFARQETNPKALYFGPYPTGSDLTGLLRFLRRIFPFVSQNHPGGRPCLRSHLGLCPCPEVFSDPQARLRYLRNLRYLREFLEGKRQTVQKKLVKEMEEASTRQEYERAALIKKKLEQINYVTSTRTLPWEYETNPNLVADRREGELAELAKILKVGKINKIECYDISNISGKQATGAQVVFVDGQAAKEFYRRYKIKFSERPDDFMMMKEMVSRRLKSDVPLPELMVIDGGKGQLSQVLEVLQEGQVRQVKVIALAKRLETIYTDDGEEIQLSLGSPVLQLLQRARDEAHRFSRKYHFLLRSRNMLT